MVVLGICDGHDAGACLMEGGHILAALSEERLTRRKRQAGFPAGAIAACLAIAGVRPEEIARVVVAERSGRAAYRLLDPWYRRTDPNRPMDRPLNRAAMIWQNLFPGRWLLAHAETTVSVRVLRRRLRRAGLVAPLSLVDHHLAHALGAAAWSGFADALVLTADAFGDGCSATAAVWRDGVLAPQVRVPYPHSPALLYGLVTAYLGFAEGDEGKIAGLAATGDPAAARCAFAELLRHESGTMRLAHVPSRRDLARRLAGIAPADVAAGVQAAVEDAVSAFARYWMERTGARDLVLAGGLFANVRLNQRVAQAAGAGDLFVHPHMGDGGLCHGAAVAATLARGQLPVGQPQSVFLGPEEGAFADAEIAAAGLAPHPLDPRAFEVLADLLAAGEAVAIVRGRMEFGPRALGHRSLLFSAQNPALAERIGRALDRPAIMPFAPVVREEDFAAVASAPPWTAFRYMTVTADAAPGIAARFPTAVHTDGTMRVQVVRRVEEPFLHDLLSAYARRVAPALLINTSFNRHAEPIVATAAQGLALARESPVAALVTGNRLLLRPGREGR